MILLDNTKEILGASLKKILAVHGLANRILEWGMVVPINMDAYVLNIHINVPEISQELYASIVFSNLELRLQKNIDDFVAIVFSKLDKYQAKLNWLIEQHILSALMSDHPEPNIPGLNLGEFK